MTHGEPRPNVGELQDMVFPPHVQLSADDLLKALQSTLALARDRQDKDMEDFFTDSLDNLLELRPELRPQDQHNL